MAQSEDAELCDLLVEALERNGSLPKIRALLRANVFLAFEDESVSIDQNMKLKQLLNIPEGVLALCLIHEFLEYSNLKNTLFVYKAESRQGKSYVYNGKKDLIQKFEFLRKINNFNEPTLITLIKCYMHSRNSNSFEKPYTTGNLKEDQNCTYIVHDDSSNSTSTSQSDSSSDEKNNTDTSSDSVKDKTNSEYIPNANILINETEEKSGYYKNDDKPIIYHKHQENLTSTIFREARLCDNTDSTVYRELNTHPFQKNLEESPSSKQNPVLPDSNSHLSNLSQPCLKRDQSATLSSISSICSSKSDSNSVIKYAPKKNELNVSSDKKHDHITSQHSKIPRILSDNNATKNEFPDPKKNNKEIENIINIVFHEHSSSDSKVTSQADASTAKYSSDFTLETDSAKEEKTSSPKLLDMQDLSVHSTKSYIPEQKSHSNQSSISISDVTDLIDYSQHNYSSEDKNKDSSHLIDIHKSVLSPRDKKNKDFDKLILTDNSNDYSISSITSLSNLSLEVHSE